MPRRTSLHDRLSATPPRGREAIYSAAPQEGSAGEPRAQQAERWEDAHKRVTFYCPISLLDAVEAEMTRSSRTKTQVIVDALTDHLRTSPRAERRSRPAAG